MSCHRLLPLLLLLVFGGASPALAAPTACPEHFPAGQAPDAMTPQQRVRTTPLCFDSYALLYSGLTRTPLYAAEHLSRERVEAAKGLKRPGAFHEEDELPKEERARPDDYKYSGYDRGHMAPADDMPDPRSEHQSFSFANVVPQNPDLNRGLWERIEETVRGIAESANEVFVVTGPIFLGETTEQLNGRVAVPSALFKAVYVPAWGAAAAYLVPNLPGETWKLVSLAELTGISGLDVFPGLAAELKTQALVLPPPVAPHPHRHPRG